MPANNSANNIRIAKNTLALYARMFFMMLISLFTSRVILDSLGEDNFGIYSVVGGVVAMFSILSGPLSGAIQRFMSFELGTGNKTRLNDVFSTAVNIQLLIAAVVFVVGEVVGLWFLNTQMNIPEGRMDAANFVFHCSILTFIVDVISLPYNASIIAHEKMGVFAYISILEAILKLVIAYLIYISPVDKLELYAALLLGVSLIVRVIYGIYCGKMFEETHYKRHLNKALFKEMMGFAGWNFFGTTAYMLNTQGVNMLINVFFGVKVNAARSIAIQVDAAMNKFVNSFITAVNPQITKSYASGDINYLYRLITYGSKFSFFLMLIMVVPVVLEADTILMLWLKEVPKDTEIFLRLVVLSTLVSTMGNSMMTGVLATGNIKRYQLKINIFGSLTFPFTWVAYLLGAPAFATYLILIVMNLLTHLIRLDELKKLINFPSKEFLTKHFSRISFVFLSVFIVPSLLCYFVNPSFLRLICTCLVSVVWSIACIYYIGLTKNERLFMLEKVKALINSKFKHERIS